MLNKNDRRTFLASTLMGASAMALPRWSVADDRPDIGRPIRLGFVGIGDRGSYHLDSALGIPGVEVPAVCDINESALARAKDWVEKSGRKTPALYGKTETDFQRLCEREDLDAVICATNWKWHTPVCLSAMNHGKHAVTEIPICLTVEDGWKLIETYEKTGKWAALAIEQVLLESDEGNHLSLLNMINEGVLGDIVHTEGGYLHDLRLVKHDPDREPWRLWHSIHRNGNLYPDHPMNRMIPYMEINHGDRFEFLVSLSSKSGMLNEYAKTYYGPDHPNVTLEMKQGDYNATILKTAGGKLATLNFDTNTPHPRGSFRVQGTKGVYLDSRDLVGPKILLDGDGHKHEWHDAGPILEEYRHPLLKQYKPAERSRLRGHGSGRKTTTPLTWHLLIECLRNDLPPYFDIYDSVTSSVVSPLTEASVAAGGRSIDFPDFTRGKWKERPRMKLDQYVPYVST